MWKVCSYTGVIFVISKLFFSLNLNVSAVWSLSIWSLRFHLCSPVWYAFLVCLTLFSLCQHHPEKNTVYAKLKSEDSVKQHSTLNKTMETRGEKSLTMVIIAIKHFGKIKLNFHYNYFVFSCSRVCDNFLADVL